MYDISAASSAFNLCIHAFLYVLPLSVYLSVRLTVRRKTRQKVQLTLTNAGRGHWRLLKVVPSDRLGMDFTRATHVMHSAVFAVATWLSVCLPRLTFKRVARVCQHQLSFFLLVFCSNQVHKMHNFRDILLQKNSRDLEIRVRGHSRTSEATRIDPPPMTSY